MVAAFPTIVLRLCWKDLAASNQYNPLLIKTKIYMVYL